MQFVQLIEKGASEVLGRHAELKVLSAPELSSELLRQRVEKISLLDEAGLVPMQKLYLVLRREFVRPLKKDRRLKLWKPSRDPVDWSRSVLMPELKLFRALIDSTRKSLDAVGVKSRILDEQEVFSLLFDQWNPGHPVEGVNFDREEIRDDLLVNDLIISTKGFILGQFHHRVVVA